MTSPTSNDIDWLHAWAEEYEPTDSDESERRARVLQWLKHEADKAETRELVAQLRQDAPDVPATIARRAAKELLEESRRSKQ